MKLSCTQENLHRGLEIVSRASGRNTALPIVRKTPINLPVSELKQAISQTIFAAAYDASRPEINGVLIKTEGKNLILAATDSYRLAERRLALTDATESISAIVPLRALQELVRILDGVAETASLFI